MRTQHVLITIYYKYLGSMPTKPIVAIVHQSMDLLYVPNVLF